MPRKRKGSAGGKGHRHSSKAKREAQHIERSERNRGMSPRRSKQIAWATVHKDMPHEKREEKES